MDGYVEPYSVEDILEKRKQSARSQGNWRDEARTDFMFRDGDQWHEEDIAKLEEEGRPAVTFNRIAPIINSVKGSEVNNRQMLRYIPRSQEDNGINEVLSRSAAYVRDNCDAEDEESDAYEDAVTCGMGWTETRVDYDEDPNGKIIIERVPPLQMRWDTSARKKNLTDRRWHLREKWLPITEIKERWGDDVELGTQDLTYRDETEFEEAHNATDAWKYENDQINKFLDDSKDKALIIHFQYKERESYYRVGDQETGRVIEFSESKFKKIKKRVDEMGMPYVKQQRWVYKEKYLAGKTLLEEGEAPVQDWSYMCLTAHREEKTNLFYGVVRAMKDPQRWANKFFCQIMHIFNTNPKGGLIYEKTAIDDSFDIESKWSDSSGIIEVEDGALAAGRIKERTMSNYPASLDKMLNFAIASIRDVSGMNVEMLGMADREQSGVLEQERKKAALVILAPLANSLRHYRKQQGRILLKFMAKYIPSNTMVRYLERGQEQYVPFTKDFDVHKYDVIVDTAPSSPNLKSEIWSSMSQMLPQLIQAGVPIPPDILDFSPLPEGISEIWKKYIIDNSANVPQLQQQLQGLQFEANQLKNENQILKTKQQQQMAAMQNKQAIAQMQNQTELQKANINLTSDDRDRIIEILKLVATADDSETKNAINLSKIDKELKQKVASSA